MPLPEGMSEFEHLQSVLMQCFNSLVRESFRDDIVEDDIHTPETALKYACLLKDEDSAQQMLLRMMLLLFVRGDMEILDKIYGIPMLDIHRDVTFQPQVKFYFKESKRDSKLHNRQTKPARMRVSFRIPQLNETTVTHTQIAQWQNKVRTLFPTTYNHVLGMDSRSYIDKKLGVFWNIKGSSKLEIMELCEKLLEFLHYICENSSSTYNSPIRFDATKLKLHSPEIDTPKTETIHFTGLEETYELETGFKGVKVWLHKVELHLHGRLKVINLLSRYV